MATGIRVVNSNGYLQIDENYSNLYLSRTVKLSALPKESRLDYYVLVLEANEKLVGICASDGEMVAEDQFYQHASNIKYYALFKGDAENVELYIFGEKAQSTESKGLRVFNTAGECVFDSGFRYMRIVRFSQNKSDSYTLDSNRKYATCTFGYNTSIIQNSQPQGVGYTFTLPVIQNNKLTVTTIQTQDGHIATSWLPQTEWGRFNMFSYFLIDVT